jgi:hypothetical protein
LRPIPLAPSVLACPNHLPRRSGGSVHTRSDEDRAALVDPVSQGSGVADYAPEEGTTAGEKIPESFAPVLAIQTNEVATNRRWKSPIFDPVESNGTRANVTTERRPMTTENVGDRPHFDSALWALQVTNIAAINAKNETKETMR